MKIKEFNSNKGIYYFELNEFKTEFHTHPALEILYSKHGGISLEILDEKFENISLAIIESNVIHRITSHEKETEVMMIEGNSNFFQKILHQFDVDLSEGFFIQKENTQKEKIISDFLKIYQSNEVPISSDLRIQKCLDYLNSTSSEYTEMIDVLKSKTNLSESRLSHLFKENVGISIKKYLVWSRLKRAFQLVIEKEINMYEAAMQSGFYDQAHLSKAFKKMLGMSPSDVYNSRMIQE